MDLGYEHEARVNAIRQARQSAGTLAAGGFNFGMREAEPKAKGGGRSSYQVSYGKSYTYLPVRVSGLRRWCVAGTKKHNIAVRGRREFGLVTRLRSAKPPTTIPRNAGQLITNCVTGHWKTFHARLDSGVAPTIRATDLHMEPDHESNMTIRVMMSERRRHAALLQQHILGVSPTIRANDL